MLCVAGEFRTALDMFETLVDPLLPNWAAGPVVERMSIWSVYLATLEYLRQREHVPLFLNLSNHLKGFRFCEGTVKIMTSCLF